jgi:hypothetical protein
LASGSKRLTTCQQVVRRLLILQYFAIRFSLSAARGGVITASRELLLDKDDFY